MTSYFMNSYNIVVDDSMIRNLMQTDMAESMDMVSIKQIAYLLFFGLLPAYIVYRLPMDYRKVKVELLSKLKQSLTLAILMLLIIVIFFKHYSSFVREHKPLRYTANPTYWIYSIGHYISNTLSSGPIVVKPIGTDAKVIKQENSKHKLIILVVGEATRADHFSLNGYKKETTPLLQKEDLINFSNVYSCGTSTAVSVPCMFSIYGKENYTHKKGLRIENVLDVLDHTNEVSVLWRDNNSNSKGVALRVPFENYKTPATNTICPEGECRDVGMLVGLDKHIATQADKDILIVLHQMGNHGPAYYKRYTKAFETFTPVCETNQLEDCTKEEINNAYDNAIRYTDAFLVQTIGLLKAYDATHQTALIYMSDHGESLGEKNLYLHGLPYFMAPDAQIHIPAFIWANKILKQNHKLHVIDKDKRYTQDNLFHTLLGLFEVETNVYDPKLDILNQD